MAVKIAGELLDLVGDGAFDTVQDLLSVCYWLVLPQVLIADM